MRRCLPLRLLGVLARWSRLDGCVAAPVVMREPDHAPDDGAQDRRATTVGRRDGTEAVLYAVEGGGHTWPGGRHYLPASIIGETSRDFDASATIWAFSRAIRTPECLPVWWIPLPR